MKSTEEMKDKFEEIIKMNATFKDKLGMILSSNCDFGSSNGAMLSVNAMPKAISDIEKLHQQAMKEERGRNKEIYKWLLGYMNFPIRRIGMGAWHWRKDLRKKLKENDIKID